MKRKIPALIITAIGVATAGGWAFAFADRAGGMENDAVARLAAASISLTQAVGAAEAHTAGRAIKAELEREHRATVFEVEVVTADNKVFEVKVDAADGRVLSSKPEQAGDHDDD